MSSSSSSSLDPFDTAKEEVVQKLNVVTALYELFHEQKQDGTGDRALSDLIKELKKNCKSVEFYLKDLEGTVKIVEKYGGHIFAFCFGAKNGLQFTFWVELCSASFLLCSTND